MGEAGAGVPGAAEAAGERVQPQHRGHAHAGGLEQRAHGAVRGRDLAEGGQEDGAAGAVRVVEGGFEDAGEHRPDVGLRAGEPEGEEGRAALGAEQEVQQEVPDSHGGRRAEGQCGAEGALPAAAAVQGHGDRGADEADDPGVEI